MNDSIKNLAENLGLDTMYDIYRSVYKYTACGPSIGFYLEGEEPGNGEAGPGGTGGPWEKWAYCDDLRAWPEISELDEYEIEVTGVSIGSIVEGVDFDCTTIVLHDDEFTVEAFWKAVEDVNDEADEIWKATHGCDDCPENPENGYRMIDPNCPTCKGEGVII